MIGSRLQERGGLFRRPGLHVLLYLVGVLHQLRDVAAQRALFHLVLQHLAQQGEHQIHGPGAEASVLDVADPPTVIQ